MSKKTIHNEYGRLSRCLLKKVQASFRDQKTIDAQWRKLNFLKAPDFPTAVAEYQKFEQVLTEAGVEISYLPEEESDTLDSIYCRDASIITDFGAVICRMGKTDRQGEPVVHKKAFNQLGISILGTIDPPGILEGGDVAWLDPKTLAIGHGYRTNDPAFVQLSGLLKQHGVKTVQVDLPHYKGVRDVFHLMSIFSPVDRDLAVVYSPLMPVRFRNLLLDRGYELVEVTDEEFGQMACNVLALAPRICLMMDDLPQTRRTLEAAGCQVITYAGRHISYFGGGGPTCLTRPLLRSH